MDKRGEGGTNYNTSTGHKKGHLVKGFKGESELSGKDLDEEGDIGYVLGNTQTKSESEEGITHCNDQ